MSDTGVPGGHRLSALLEGVVDADVLRAPALRTVAITGLACDGRRVRPGDLFLARNGRHVHGSRFIGDALRRGAAAVLYEPRDAAPLPPAPGVPVIAVAQLAARAGLIADRFYRQLSRGLFTTAVTGTNGKTTVTWLIAHALSAAGRPAGLIGTLGNGLAGRLEPTDHTTPHACEIHALLQRFQRQGARAMVMEASSHGIDQGRLHGLDLDAAVFTNLTRDHLDYHGNMESYGRAKRRLFQHPGLRAAVLNADDPWGRRILAELPATTEAWCYSLGAGRATAPAGRDAIHWVRATRVESRADGLAIEVATPNGHGRIDSPCLGRFNAANLLAALAVLERAGLGTQEACRYLGAVPPVPGRMQRIRPDPGAAAAERPLPSVVVDYAHTPDALDNALAALRPHCAGSLVCVFGCGGERDHGKRPEMGAIAAARADRVWLTDDNPRGEAGAAIIAAIRAGMPATARVEVEHDRAAAIAAAIAAARPGDVVLIAGKGHETYQQIGAQRRHFSDPEQVRQALARYAQHMGGSEAS